jgi:hypothetical protein
MREPFRGRRENVKQGWEESLGTGLTTFGSQEPEMRVALGKRPIRKYPQGLGKGCFMQRTGHVLNAARDSNQWAFLLPRAWLGSLQATNRAPREWRRKLMVERLLVWGAFCKTKCSTETLLRPDQWGPPPVTSTNTMLYTHLWHLWAPKLYLVTVNQEVEFYSLENNYNALLGMPFHFPLRNNFRHIPLPAPEF